MHLGPDADSVVPTGLDLGATSIPGLKPGALFFPACGTRLARDATTCPRSNRMGSHGGLPLQGEADGQSRMRRHCARVIAAPKGRPRITRGKSRGTRDVAPGNSTPLGQSPERAIEIPQETTRDWPQRGRKVRKRRTRSETNDCRGRRSHTGSGCNPMPSQHSAILKDLREGVPRHGAGR